MKRFFVLILATSLALFGCSNSGDSSSYASAAPTTPETTTPVNTGPQETGNGTGNEMGDEQPQETTQTENPNSGGGGTNSQETGNGAGNETGNEQPQETNQTENPNSAGEGTNSQETGNENGNGTNTNPTPSRVEYCEVTVNFIVEGEIVETSTVSLPSTLSYSVKYWGDNKVPTKQGEVLTRIDDTIVNVPSKATTITTAQYKVRLKDDTTKSVIIKKTDVMDIVSRTYQKTIYYTFEGWELSDGTTFGCHETHYFAVKKGAVYNAVAKFSKHETEETLISQTSEIYNIVRTKSTDLISNTLITKENALTFEEAYDGYYEDNQTFIDENDELFHYEQGSNGTHKLVMGNATTAYTYYAKYVKTVTKTIVKTDF